MNESPAPSGMLPMRNPFTVKSPEELTREQIVRLFIAQYTKIEVIKERKHTFIWGSRGSGKSMMLRYLEPLCKSVVHNGFEGFLKQEGAFIGVYCPCKEGQLNKSELTILDPQPRMIIAEHLLNLAVAEQILRCLREQFPVQHFTQSQASAFVKRVLGLFDRASIASSLVRADEEAERDSAPMQWLDAIFRVEISKLGSFLRNSALSRDASRYDAATTSYHDFLLPFIQAARNLIGVPGVPYYILLDDADHLNTDQQQIVNMWVANRDQQDVCFKVSSRREGYRSFLTRDRVEIDEPHDYSSVDVDELYTASKSDYAKKVALIANRRLDLSAVPTKNIEEFLPPDAYQEDLLQQTKREAADEWSAKGQPGRQSDYVTRYAMARLFQKLQSAKKRRNYAGFSNMVHLSSGIVRDFLEPCYLMFDKLLDKGIAPRDIKEIDSATQDEILFQYSEGFLIHGIEEIRKKTAPEKWGELSSLETLISSLGKLFYERLHDPESREARLFSFTVRGQIPDDLASILRTGVEHRYFQLRTYSTKEGGGRENWYILNRRLCPVFKLDPTGFEGRISLTPEHLRLACQNSSRFLQLRLRQPQDADETPELRLFE